MPAWTLARTQTRGLRRMAVAPDWTSAVRDLAAALRSSRSTGVPEEMLVALVHLLESGIALNLLLKILDLQVTALELQGTVPGL